MEVEELATSLGADDQNFNASHESTYKEKKGWDFGEEGEHVVKREGYSEERIDAELDYDEDNRDSEHSSFQGDEEHEVYHDGDACLVSDDEVQDDGENNIDGSGQFNVENPQAEESLKSEVKEMEYSMNGTKKKREPSEEGEIDDLEEGELRSDSESDAEQILDEKSQYALKGQEKTAIESKDGKESAVSNVCKFYLRGNCTWGLDCKYVHPDDSSRERIQSSSRTRNTEWQSVERERNQDAPSLHSRMTYSNPNNDKNEPVASHGSQGESAWERGLREARELMKKATKKKEEPDFEKKRLVLAPSEELDRRTTDDDSDDSRLLSKNTIRGDMSPRRKAPSNNFTYNDARSRQIRRYDRFSEQNMIEGPLGSRNGYRSDHYPEDYGRPAVNYNSVNRSRIPSLMDGIRENRFVEIKKDLGPQVLYPNGRPGSRRRDSNLRRSSKRDMPLNERYYVPRRLSRSPHSSRSPVRSLSPRRGILPVSRSGSEKSGPTRKQHNLGQNLSLSCSGPNIRDPWDRSQRKRNRSRDLPPNTLGAALHKARISEERARSRKRPHSTSISESSVSESSSVTSRSTSSDRRRKAATKASLAAAVPLKSLFDDDGSIRQTDLSSFRIPKKKRSSRSPSRPTTVLNRSTNKTYSIHSEPNPRNESQSSSRTKWQNGGSPNHNLQLTGKIRTLRNIDAARNERRLSEAKEEISSEESSSCSSESSTDEDNEPAAYRRKRKSKTEDDGLPTEGIPLSPEAEAEDVSSDENERSLSPKREISGSPSGSHSTCERHITPSITHDDVERREEVGSGSEHVDDDDEEDDDGDEEEEDDDDGEDDDDDDDGDDDDDDDGDGGGGGGNEDVGDDYEDEHHNESEVGECMDDEAGKEERRAELLRQLKCVEEAIARKRHRPVT